MGAGQYTFQIQMTREQHVFQYIKPIGIHQFEHIQLILYFLTETIM